RGRACGERFAIASLAEPIAITGNLTLPLLDGRAPRQFAPLQLRLLGRDATLAVMAEMRVEHVFNCSEETFWTKVFFDDEYNRRLFVETLRFPVWRVLKSEDQGDEVRRTIEASPPIGDLPGALKAVIGDNAGYEERGVFNKKTH